MPSQKSSQKSSRSIESVKSFSSTRSILGSIWQTRELMKLEETKINKRIFVEVEISMREGIVMTTGSKGRSSGDVVLQWKKVM